MPRKYREYTDEKFLECVKQVKSIASLHRALGLKPCGGNYAHTKKLLQKLSADTTHWTGQGWSKGQQLKDWSNYSRAIRLKPHLISLRGNQCESCKLTEWQGFPIPLEIHHKDADRTNNGLDNLQLLCNNCHALTDSWRKPRF